jgi:hypothetical protein
MMKDNTFTPILMKFPSAQSLPPIEQRIIQSFNQYYKTYGNNVDLKYFPNNKITSIINL